MKFSLLAAAWLWAVPLPASAQVAILHIQVTEGEGAVHLPGSRSTRPMTVQVTDETGKPVEGASVSFHLPDEGPGGTFGNGLRTDVATTDNRGLAGIRGFQVNRIVGRFQVRIVASKEQVRAGTICSQYVGGAGVSASTSLAAPPAASGSVPKLSRGWIKWVAVAAAVAGGAVAGAVAAGGHSGSTPVAPAASPVTLGTPTITVGKP